MNYAKMIMKLSRSMVLYAVSTPRSGLKLNRKNEPQRNYPPHPQTCGLRVWGCMLFILSFLLSVRPLRGVILGIGV